MRKRRGAANRFIRLFWVNTQLKTKAHRLIVFGRRKTFHDFNRFGEQITFRGIIRLQCFSVSFAPVLHNQTISIPMLRAVPSTIRTALFNLVVFKSGIFSLAICSTSARLTLPFLVLPGPPLALAGPAAFLS